MSEATAKTTDVATKDETKEGNKNEKKYQKIVLVAVDGSNASMRALDWYVDELHKDGNFVICMHSFELPLMHSYEEMYVSPDMWQATLKKEADRTAHMEKTLMRKLKAKGIPSKFIARGGGKPGEAILSAADDEDVDMILMGTRGRGKLMRVLLGSVSNYVISNAHCPVLVYRDKQKEKERLAKREKSHEEENKEEETKAQE